MFEKLRFFFLKKIQVSIYYKGEKNIQKYITFIDLWKVKMADIILFSPQTFSFVILST